MGTDWWIDVYSLAATIQLARPDIPLSVSIKDATPIPDTMPPDFMSRNVNIVEGIGEPVSACFLGPATLENGTKWYHCYDSLCI